MAQEPDDQGGGRLSVFSSKSIHPEYSIQEWVDGRWFRVDTIRDDYGLALRRIAELRAARPEAAFRLAEHSVSVTHAEEGGPWRELKEPSV